MEDFYKLLPEILATIKSLKTLDGKDVKRIHCTRNRNKILISKDDISRQSNLYKIRQFTKMLIETAAWEQEEAFILKQITNQVSSFFSQLKTTLCEQINEVQETFFREIINHTTSQKATTFLEDYSNGLIDSSDSLINSLKSLAPYIVATRESFCSLKITELSEIFEKTCCGLINDLKNLPSQLSNTLEKSFQSNQHVNIPTKFKCPIKLDHFHMKNSISFRGRGIVKQEEAHVHKFYIMSTDGRVRCIERASDDKYQQIFSQNYSFSSSYYFNSFTLNPLGTHFLLSECNTGGITLCTNQGEILRKWENTGNGLALVSNVWLDNSTFACGYYKGQIQLMSTDRSDVQFTCQPFKAHILAMSIGNREKKEVLVGDASGNTFCYSFDSKEVKWKHNHHASQVFTVVKVKNTPFVASGGYDKKIVLYNEEIKQKVSFVELQYEISSLFPHSSGSIILAQTNVAIYMLNINENALSILNSIDKSFFGNSLLQTIDGYWDEDEKESILVGTSSGDIWNLSFE